jgi:Carboxypeptidase regulatory-like domain
MSIVHRPGKRARLASGRFALCKILLVFASCILLTAQNVVLTGSLGGRVTDQDAAAVPNALVVLRNLATGARQSAQTNNSGLYRFQALMPGVYSVTVSLRGFRDTQALVRVQVGNATLQDVQLRVGASADTVKVTGNTPLLRPEESSASTVLERSFIENLPLSGRRYTDFTLLPPNTPTEMAPTHSPWTAPTRPATTLPTF